MNTEDEIDLFDDCIQEIELAYENLGHKFGWRFLGVSKKVLQSTADIALITLHPEGSRNPAGLPSASCEDGVSYLVEAWGDEPPGRAKIQVQVQRMFKLLRDKIGFQGAYADLMSQSLIGHFIPFRTPRFDKMARKIESIALGHYLWAKVFLSVRPKLIICLGKVAQRELRYLARHELDAKLLKTDLYPTGCREYNAEIDSYTTPRGKFCLMYLPHLSTWTLFIGQHADNMPGIIEIAVNESQIKS